MAKWLMIVHVVSDAAVSGEGQATSERKYSEVNQLAATQLLEYSSAWRPRTSAGTRREGSSVNAGQALSKGSLAGRGRVQDKNLPGMYPICMNLFYVFCFRSHCSHTQV